MAAAAVAKVPAKVDVSSRPRSGRRAHHHSELQLRSNGKWHRRSCRASHGGDRCYWRGWRPARGLHSVYWWSGARRALCSPPRTAPPRRWSAGPAAQCNSSASSVRIDRVQVPSKTELIRMQMDDCNAVCRLLDSASAPGHAVDLSATPIRLSLAALRRQCSLASPAFSLLY